MTTDKPDNRYTVELEWCGHGEPRHVVRFCGDWISQHANRFTALRVVIKHNQKR